jgi:DNA-binding protein WhiA
VSLSDDLRNELAAIAPRRGCDRLAELSALFHTAGSFHLRGQGEVSVQLDLGSSAVARRAFRLLRELGVSSELRTYRQRAFGRPSRYQLRVHGDERALAVLREGGVLSSRNAPLARPPKRVAGRACCRAAYLRGALLGGGSISGPRGLHLEIRSASVEGAEFVRRLAAQEGVELGLRDRERHAAAYAKGADAIVELIALAGASDCALAIEEHVVVGAARAEANRLANADHANLVRSSRAAHDQLRAVLRLEHEGRLEALPPALREIAELRRRYPSLSLRELALKCRPPATKAAAHRRLRKLARLARI